MATKLKIKDEIARLKVKQYLKDGFSLSKIAKEINRSYSYVKMIALQEGYTK